MENRKYLDINKLEEAVFAPVDEAETVINVNRTDDRIEIYSSDNTMITKIKRAALKNPKEWKCWESDRDVKGRLRGYFFSAPKKALSFRGGNKKDITEEQREAIRARFAKARETN